VADTHSIHLIRTPQVPPKPQPLDPADIAGEALAIARECAAAMLFPRTPVLVLWARALELQEPTRR
jgi:hypothetical protein